ncbi:hypothetical protein QRX50_41850 [Amycolatopsis carbonis]|uniref:Uncharacterized protein n=1 Tax=Amycolatopsis carbonis TaxID=715471 RepID=A0A9Y2MWJ9_9PSEU|nr:hypothetical protein [Amycolatopsis sp. 2-15]WIX77877.1 hypothetical protein QRX50_41850 [Amycolatopsis sp. 2-15]
MLKALSPQVTHRAAVGLVRLGVGDRATAEQTYRELAARTEALGADLLGVVPVLTVRAGAVVEPGEAPHSWGWAPTPTEPAKVC